MYIYIYIYLFTYVHIHTAYFTIIYFCSLLDLQYNSADVCSLLDLCPTYGSMQLAEVCHISGRCFQIYQACGQHTGHRWPTPDSGAVFESPLERRGCDDLVTHDTRKKKGGSWRISIMNLEHNVGRFSLPLFRQQVAVQGNTA